MLIIYLSALDSEEDRDLFTRLYEEQAKQLKFIAYHILQQDEDAENVVHDAFLKIAEEFSKYRKCPYEELIKISITITKHKAIDLYRHRKMADGKAEEIYLRYEEHFPDPESFAVENEEKNLLKEEYIKLPEDLQDIFYLHFYEGYKPREIAKMLDMDSADISRRLYNMKQTMKKNVAERKK